MASKLKTLKPRLATLPPRIGRAPGDEVGRNRQRDTEQPWRAWYKTARWQQLRERVIVRDLFICQKTGALLTGTHPDPNSPVVDHVTPHRGDERLFWDEANLMTVSKAWHDSVKQAEERAGYGAR